MSDKIYKKAKEMTAELSMQYFLHDRGYTYFNINALTYKQINQLIDGHRVVVGKEGV